MCYLSPMCCNFWDKCVNSHKIGQGCGTPLNYRDYYVRTRPSFYVKLTHQICMVFNNVLQFEWVHNKLGNYSSVTKMWGWGHGQETAWHPIEPLYVFIFLPSPTPAPHTPHPYNTTATRPPQPDWRGNVDLDIILSNPRHTHTHTHTHTPRF